MDFCDFSSKIPLAMNSSDPKFWSFILFFLPNLSTKRSFEQKGFSFYVGITSITVFIIASIFLVLMRRVELKWSQDCFKKICWMLLKTGDSNHVYPRPQRENN